MNRRAYAVRRDIERNRFGRALASLRVSQGWTQEEVGNRLGVARNVVARWETDRCDPSARNLARLARLFEVTMDDLWSGRVLPAEDTRLRVGPAPEQP
jgi:transcriptional regulator with XRE-family HTH domain